MAFGGQHCLAKVKHIPILPTHTQCQSKVSFLTEDCNISHVFTAENVTIENVLNDILLYEYGTSLPISCPFGMAPNNDTIECVDGGIWTETQLFCESQQQIDFLQTIYFYKIT